MLSWTEWWLFGNKAYSISVNVILDTFIFGTLKKACILCYVELEALSVTVSPTSENHTDIRVIESFF